MSPKATPNTAVRRNGGTECGLTVGVQVLRYRDEPAAPVCDGANVSPSIAHVLPRAGATCASPAHSNGVNEIEHPTLAHRDVLTKFHESCATPYWSVVKASGLVKPFPGAFFWTS